MEDKKIEFKMPEIQKRWAVGDFLYEDNFHVELQNEEWTERSFKLFIIDQLLSVQL